MTSVPNPGAPGGVSPLPPSAQGGVTTNGPSLNGPPHQPASVVPPIPRERGLKLLGHVGFDSMPDQLVGKLVGQGFSFNILCIGETGIGKTTLMETLFNSRLESDPAEKTGTSGGVPQAQDGSSFAEVPVSVRTQTLNLKEGNIRLRLTIAESRGYGEQIDKAASAEPLVAYVDTQLENYLQEELKLRRNFSALTNPALPTTFQDPRVHLCLYLLAPSGHTLRAVDLLTMQKLHKKVNLVPVIAKSDTVTKTELPVFKARIMEEIKNFGIELYQFPTDDDSISDFNNVSNAMVPLAVVGSTEEVRASGAGRGARGRQYPWGTVLVENELHCDFVRLREALIRTNLEDLRERTHRVHFERYRAARLSQMGYEDEKLSLQETYEQRRQQLMKEQQRAEEAMRASFVARIREKESELKEAEKELYARFEALKRAHAEEKKRVESKKAALEEDIGALARRRAVVAQATAAQQGTINASSGSAFTSGTSTLLKSMKKK